MSKKRKAQQEAPSGLAVVWARVEQTDMAELRKRESATGSPIAWQIRKLVHEGLKRKVIT